MIQGNILFLCIMQKEEILQVALRMLSRKMQSEGELRKKLSRMFPENEKEQEEVLSECRRLKLTDDEKFAREYVQYRQHTSPRSAFFLQCELENRGILSELAHRVAQEEDDEQTARDLVQRKMRVIKVIDQKEQEKIIRFLRSRGFSFSTIQKAISCEEQGEIL